MIRNNLNLFTILSLKNRIKKLLGFSVPRQPFNIGYTNIIDQKQLYKKLISIDYQWNYFSYYDPDEIINVRKLYADRQIHIRIFKDGEIRIHDELNYEYDMIGHLEAKTFKQVDKKEIEKILNELT